MTHDEYIQTLWQRLAVVLDDILHNHGSLVAHSREIVSIYAQLNLKDKTAGELFTIFRVIDSDSDEFPLGAPRKLWAESSLIEMDKERDSIEEFYKKDSQTHAAQLLEFVQKMLANP